MKLKVCGMKHVDNIKLLSELNLDYMGFIFYDKSPRHMTMPIPNLPANIKKVGVFVDDSIHRIVEKVLQFELHAIQLHGSESTTYIKELKSEIQKQLKSSTNDAHMDSIPIAIWKVFGVKTEFNFDSLVPYEGIVDAFLFDTKGAHKGGNGYSFDWKVLDAYTSSTPFILSGGIGPDSLEAIKIIQNSKLPLYAIDVNSKFEIEPGLKDIEALKEFKTHLMSEY